MHQHSVCQLKDNVKQEQTLVCPTSSCLLRENFLTHKTQANYSATFESLPYISLFFFSFLLAIPLFEILIT